MFENQSRRRRFLPSILTVLIVFYLLLIPSFSLAAETTVTSSTTIAAEVTISTDSAATETVATEPVATEPEQPAEGVELPSINSQTVMARLAAGLQHSAMINYDGRLYLWGDNTYGQLGIAGTDYSDRPQLVEMADSVTAVSLGAYHTLVLLADGTVWSFGRNVFGQLGTGGTENSYVPVQVEGLPPVKAVSAGAWHSMALGTDGSVWAWGNNTNLQIGDVDSEIVKDAEGSILGTRSLKPAQIISSGASAIAAGGLFSMYLGNDGLVYTWGENNRGQLGDGSIQPHAKPALVLGISGVTAIAAGYQHSMAVSHIDDHDELMVWGDDSLGQLGSGDGLTADAFETLPLRVDLTGDNSAANDHLLAIRAGYSQSAATVPVFEANGTVKANRSRFLVWGSNSNGQLALGDLPSQKSPVFVSGSFNNWTGSDFLAFDDFALGGQHMLVLSSKGLLAAAGSGERGQLGSLSIIDRDHLVPVEIPDVIRPIWLDGCQASAVFDRNNHLVVRWPAAQDNQMVTKYQGWIETPDGTTRTFDAGSELSWTFTDIDELSAYKITVMACDSGSVFADPETLSRLICYVLPVNAEPGAAITDYFSTIDQSTLKVEYLANNWQPDSRNMVRPLEVPWNTSSIYKSELIEQPGNWHGFIAAAALAMLLILLTAFDIWRRKHSLFKFKKFYQ